MRRARTVGERRTSLRLMTVVGVIAALLTAAPADAGRTDVFVDDLGVASMLMTASGDLVVEDSGGGFKRFDADGELVWSTDSGSGELVDVDGEIFAVGWSSLLRLDPDDGSVLDTYPTPGGNIWPTGASIGDVLYVSVGGSLTAFDTDAETFTDLQVTAGSIIRTAPGQAGVVWVAEGSFPWGITRYDVTTVPATATANVAPDGFSLRDVTVDGTHVYVVSFEPAEIEVFDATTLADLDDIALAPVLIKEPAGIEYVAGVDRLVVSGSDDSFDGRVAMYDLGTTTWVAEWELDWYVFTDELVASPDGERAYVEDYQTLSVLTPGPGAPTDVIATPDQGSATVAWTPADDEATSYTVTSSPGGLSCTTAGTSCVVDGLTNGTGYRFRVVASSPDGDSIRSQRSNRVVPDLVPAAAVDISISEDGDVDWSAPGGGAVNDLVVRYIDYQTPSPRGLDPFVVGGTRVGIDPHEHTVKLLAFDSSREFMGECDGVLVSHLHVLTAAHCVDYGSTSPSFFVVLYGLADWTDAVDDLDTYRRFGDRLAVHPDYSDLSPRHDIALVVLDEPVDPRHATPIPFGDVFDPVDGDAAYLVGWGATETGGVPSDDLLGLDVVVDGSCGDWPAELGFDFFDPGMFCAAATSPDAGACSGDSGGPLVANVEGAAVLIGLVSYGAPTGCASDPDDRPDVYVDVGYYENWIEGHIGDVWSSASASGTSASLPDLLPGRSYLVSITASNHIGTTTSFASFDTDGLFVMDADEIGIDCTGAVGHPFGDVAPTSFAFDSVGCIFALGVTTGTSDTTYSPGDLVTRGQMGAFLARFFERLTGERCTGDHPFVDIATTSFVHAPVGCIYDLGLTTGTSATTYSPGASVTRAQMAAFIARIYRLVTGEECGSPAPFGDVATTSFAYLDVGCIFDLGVTTGTSPTTYSPGANVTREQMAAFLERLYNAIAA